MTWSPFVGSTATSTLAHEPDQPTSLSSLLVLRALTHPAAYLPAHTFDTTTSLASRVPDGSKGFVKSLADIFVISLRIKTGSQRGHKQQILILPPRAYSPIQPYGWRATLVEQIQGQITNGRKRPSAEVRRRDHTAIKRSSALSPQRSGSAASRAANRPLQPVVRRFMKRVKPCW
ncbi:MAG: hypothetical protein EWM73_03481 [Nitrospira sp.]|nr:MAG: hypothetical protein EWM73_03481 [Nitrospira sp.]